MKILSAGQIRAVDGYVVERGYISSIDLMERAAKACVDWLTNRFDEHKKIAVFAGSGNNGGDGLAIARMLRMLRYDVSVYMLTGSGGLLSPDALVNYQRLGDINPVVLTEKYMPKLPSTTIVVDALFGIGLSRPLNELAAQTVAHINKSGCTVVAIDMPSGLFCDDNTGNNPQNIIRAHYTLTFQQPKLSFFFGENAAYVGDWTILDIGILPEAIEKQDSKYFVLHKRDIAGYIEPRKKFAHKGNFGHAFLLAGSQGMMGACVLAAKSCLRAGAGLVTARIPTLERTIMQVAVPEAIVSCYDTDFDINAYSAIGVGPGIGNIHSSRPDLAFIFKKSAYSGNIVFDADALNIISEYRYMPPNSILTPHPKEFDRLAGVSENGYMRHLKQIEMAREHNVFIVLKGAHTSIATPDGHCFFNTTGNPGMATAGSGDVLTGIILSFLAQGMSPQHAACSGVMLHGIAGDIAARRTGQQALIASDIIKSIGEAFKEIGVEC